MTRNSGTSSDGRNPDGTFAPGNPGKPKGSRHRATRAVEGLLQGSSESLTQKALDLALDGDTTALRLCLERIAPVRKDTPIEFDLPDIQDVADAASAARAVLKAVSDGELTPLEGAAVMGLVDSFRRTLEVSEIEDRLSALEEK